MTYEEFCEKIHHIIPVDKIEINDLGNITIHTNLMANDQRVINIVAEDSKDYYNFKFGNIDDYKYI